MAGVEFGLACEFMVPLATFRPNDEPLLALVASLAEARSGELGLVQVLFEACRHPWAASILRSVSTPQGEPFFADAPELTSLAREKISSPLFAVALRVAAAANDVRRAKEIVRRLAGCLAPFGSPLKNEFLPLEDSEFGVLEEDLLARTTHRPGMLLSADELASLLHIPGAGVRIDELWRGTSRSRSAPSEVLREGSFIGVNEHEGVVNTVRLSPDVKGKHVHIVGASGTGKSTLLVRMILEDVAAGHGVGVIDPHGDLVDEVFERIPPERAAACTLFDPSDDEAAIGWNILGADSEAERELIASDLVGVFQRLSTSWGDQMTAILGNAILVFLESPLGGTLLDLRQFLVDAAFRGKMLATVSDPYLVSFWNTEFTRLVGRRPETPILTRLDMFLRSRLVRRVVTANENRLDFRTFTDQGGIFLAKLASGTMGQENASLLGSLLVSKFHQVTLARAAQDPASRRPFFLYIDEFHAVATASMASLFSGARKYRLGVVVAHQDLSQLHASLPELERSILGNAYTRICFRVGEEDARQLSKGLSHFSAEDLSSLGLGEAICRVGGYGSDFNLRTEPLEPMPAEAARSGRDAVRSAARNRQPIASPPPPPEDSPEPAGNRIPTEAVQSQYSPQEPAATHRVPRLGEPRPEHPDPEVEPPIDKATLDYLALVARSPFLSVRERNTALGLSAWSGNRLKDAILESGLASEIAVNPGGRGKRFKLLELTERGRELAIRYGIRLVAGHGRGGLVHQWWAKTIADWLCSKGAKNVVIEDSSRGVRIDIAAELGGQEVAIEIELRESHSTENIQKDLGAGYSRVVCLLDCPKSEKRIRAKLGVAPENVTFGDLRRYEDVLGSLLTSLREPNQKEEQKGRRKPASAPEPPALPLPDSLSIFEPGAFSTPLAADYLGLSPATLETLRTRGGGPAFAKLGRRVVYARQDLDRWINERKHASTTAFLR